MFAGAVLAGALMVYALRSWRLVWAPVFTAALGVGALGFDGVQGAVTPALSGLAIAAAVFAVFGLVNKVRDAARLERRIAVLADHILRNPPEEMVAGEAEQAVDDAPEATHEPEDEAPQVAPVAVAAAYRSGDQDAPSEAEDTSLRPEAGAPGPMADPRRKPTATPRRLKRPRRAPTLMSRHRRPRVRPSLRHRTAPGLRRRLTRRLM